MLIPRNNNINIINNIDNNKNNAPTQECAIGPGAVGLEGPEGTDAPLRGWVGSPHPVAQHTPCPPPHLPACVLHATVNRGTFLFN